METIFNWDMDNLIRILLSFTLFFINSESMHWELFVSIEK